MEAFLQEAKEASRTLASLDTKKKVEVLYAFAKALEQNSDTIIAANAKDMQHAQEVNLSSALKDRLLLNEERIIAMANGVRKIAALKEPVGRVLEGWVNEDGLNIQKVTVPIGVIGIIYESRPNVTSDTAALCFKSSNVCVLKGGKEAQESNMAIATTLQGVLEEFKLPKSLVSLLPDSSREGVAKLIKMDKYVDLIVPRGGEGLIRYVSENASVPVIKHDKGLCHVYVEKNADLQKALDIVVNAKVQRPGVCNSMETLLVDYEIAEEFLPKLQAIMNEYKVVIKGCDTTRSVINVERASDSDFDIEHLDLQFNLKTVSGVFEAINHITRHGSGHSEAIITENYSVAEQFLNEVDASSVYVNASTRFTDGEVFGFGAEVGISTNKLHARGPMGINELTTYKFKVYGNGQIR